MKIKKVYICPNCGKILEQDNHKEECIGYGDNIRCTFCDYSSIDRDFVKTIIIPETEAKQIILITESNGDANIEWDVKSLEEAKILLQHSLDFIIQKQ